MKGKVLDVAVDLRRCSGTYGRHVAVELSEDNHRQFFIPRGFAHGFSVLSGSYAEHVLAHDPTLENPVNAILASELRKDKYHVRDYSKIS